MKIVQFYSPKAVKCEPFLHLVEDAGMELHRVNSDGLSDEDTLKECEGADAIITTIKGFTAEMIEALPDSVKAIVRVAMGYEIIDLEAANKRGIYVCNVPDYAMEDVAVMQVAHILNAVRKVTYYDRKVREGHFTHLGYLEGYEVHRVSTLNIGLLGFGRIAKNVAKYMKAFGATVYAYDPFLPESVFEEYGVVHAKEKEDIFKLCDVISTNIPLTDESFHIIGKESIPLMKDGVIIVNTGRGPLVDEEAVLEGLKSGKISAVGMDVFEKEPIPLDDELLSFDNVYVTPHVAYYSAESVLELQRKAVEYAIEGAKGEVPRGAVNKNCRG